MKKMKQWYMATCATRLRQRVRPPPYPQVHRPPRHLPQHPHCRPPKTLPNLLLLAMVDLRRITWWILETMAPRALRFPYLCARAIVTMMMIARAPLYVLSAIQTRLSLAVLALAVGEPITVMLLVALACPCWQMLQRRSSHSVHVRVIAMEMMIARARSCAFSVTEMRPSLDALEREQTQRIIALIVVSITSTLHRTNTHWDCAKAAVAQIVTARMVFSVSCVNGMNQSQAAQEKALLERAIVSITPNLARVLWSNLHHQRMRQQLHHPLLHQQLHHHRMHRQTHA
mmetsp:Transcript_14859/g.25384  ORF Transcript_14859/g.25384 Transcript_14859/m.25384 type:complete len:286 (+) Transcript_14859:338-1195(+)